MGDSIRSEAAEKIRRVGLRVTPQRTAVLEFLTATCSHPTADEIGSAVNQRFPTVSRASVYNVLHSLRRAGLVREVVAGHAVTRYDANMLPHHHFVCRGCGKIEDVAWESASLPADIPLPERSVAWYEVIFHGACRGCGDLASASA